LIRVCLVDDQALVRSGLKALLGLLGGIEVVAEAADGEEAITAVTASKPDVLLLDVRMPRLNGVQVVEELASKGTLPPTLLLTTFEDDSALIQGVKAGARGYLLKGASPETLLDAIRAVAGGGTYLYAPLVSDIAREGMRASRSLNDDAPDMLEALTERELEILRLMASGIGNREIAAALVLREGTVKNHVSSIFSKLGVTDRTKAVLRAIAAGLV
jgi:DNA-binding NarL/FixJ family response regulator